MGAKPSRSTSDAVAAIREVLALVAGLGVLVYVCGVATLAIRMAVRGLPASAVVGQLPRDWVLSIGLAVVLPSALLGGLYGLARLLSGSGIRPPGFRRWDEATRRERVGFLLTTVLGTVLAAAPPSVAIVTQEPVGDRTIAIVIPVAALATLAALNARARIAHAHATPRQYNRPRALLAMVAVVAAWATPSALMTAAALPLLDAQVCTRADTHLRGWFLGESASDIYVGENVGEHKVAAVPRELVEEMFTGAGALDVVCRAPRRRN